MDKVERNKRHFEQFQQEVAVRGDFTNLDTLMAPEFLAHRSANVTVRRLNGAEIPDKPMLMSRDDFKRAWSVAMAGRTDHARRIEEIYGEGDVIFARFAIEWTHADIYQGIPPSGRRVCIHEAAVVHYDDEGRMCEGWFITDPLEMFEQLGAKVEVGSR